jgi:hypothetical protein
MPLPRFPDCIAQGLDVVDQGAGFSVRESCGDEKRSASD